MEATNIVSIFFELFIEFIEKMIEIELENVNLFCTKKFN